MHHELKQKAVKLRTEKQLSYNAILAQIPVAKSTLHEWLKHYPLNKEKIHELRKIAWKKNETKIEMFRESMRLRRETIDKSIYENYLKKFEDISNESMFIAGLMLYLGEGAKTDKYSTSITNTDPRIIKFFLKWIVKYFKIPKNKLRIFLQLYPTMNIDKEVNFWLNELGLKKDQLYKPFIRKLHASSFSYKESFRHGTCALSYSKSQTKREIMMAIKALTDSVFKKI